MINRKLFSVATIPLLSFGLMGAAITETSAKEEIIYDAEYVKTYNQHTAEWDQEDDVLQKRLAALEAKTGSCPHEYG